MSSEEWVRQRRKRGRLRDRFAPGVAAGLYACPFCGGPIVPGEPWDLDHALPGVWDVEGEATFDPEMTRPAHRSCNRRHGQRLATARKRLRAATPCAGCGGRRPPGSGWLCGSCVAVVNGP